MSGESRFLLIWQWGGDEHPISRRAVVVTGHRWAPWALLPNAGECAASNSQFPMIYRPFTSVDTHTHTHTPRRRQADRHLHCPIQHGTRGV